MLISPNLQKLTAHSTPFVWNDDLQKELDEMKAVLRQRIKLTPLDTSKDLLAVGDGGAVTSVVQDEEGHIRGSGSSGAGT